MEVRLEFDDPDISVRVTDDGRTQCPCRSARGGDGAARAMPVTGR